MAVELSVVIPTYNEENRLLPTLERMVEYLQQQAGDWEILVVDDGSQDQTVSLAQRFAEAYAGVRVLANAKNKGKGAVVRQGMLDAKGAWRLFSDADLSTPIEELAHLRAAADQEGADVVIASRDLAESQVEIHQPWHRELFGKVFNRLVRWWYLPEFSDTQCGFKLFSAHAAEQVFGRSRLDGIVFDVELLYLARLQAFKVSEVPVVWRNSDESRIKTSLRNAWLVIRDLWSIRQHRHAAHA